MPAELFANNFAVQLASGCANTDSSLTLASTVPAALQAAGQWRAIISDSYGTEYVIVPGGQAGPTVAGVTRGAEGSTATSHSPGAWVTHLLTAGALFGGSTASVLAVGAPAPGSGATGDLVLVRSDGTMMRFTPPDVYATAWGLSTSASAAANTTALQSAGAAAAARKATLVLPDGTYPFNGVQFANQKGLRIRGAGSQSTILQVAANNAIGLDFFGSVGTGDTSDIHISDLQVSFTGSGVTGVRFWNVQPFSCRRVIVKADLLPLSVQGSFVGTVEDCELYLQGSNTTAIAALWLGSGKSAPHTGSPTLSGNGNLRFGSCVISSANGPAVIVEDNTIGVTFETTELTANVANRVVATHGVVEIDASAANDSLGAAVTFERCYQEGSALAAADFALGTWSGHCNRVTIRGYESTGSSGMNYAVDVASCDHLIVEQLNCIAYTLGVVNFRTGYLTGLVGNTKAQLRCEQIDNGGNAASPIYVDADSHISSTYRGPIVRTNTWKHVLTRVARFDASVVTGAGTYPLAQSNPTAAGAGDANEGLAYFYFDPADVGYAPLRVRVSVMVNATAPAANLSCGLVPTSGSPAGGAGAVTQGNGAFALGAITVSAPAAGSLTTTVTATGYITSAGWYALAVSSSGAFTASSSVAVALRLEAMS